MFKNPLSVLGSYIIFLAILIMLGVGFLLGNLAHDHLF